MEGLQQNTKLEEVKMQTLTRKQSFFRDVTKKKMMKWPAWHDMGMRFVHHGSILYNEYLVDKDAEKTQCTSQAAVSPPNQEQKEMGCRAIW
jgi:hypothetical protein